MLDLPPVKTGLLTKLNLLTIGLIFLTAVTTRSSMPTSAGATRRTS